MLLQNISLTAATGCTRLQHSLGVRIAGNTLYEPSGWLLTWLVLLCALSLSSLAHVQIEAQKLKKHGTSVVCSSRFMDKCLLGPNDQL